MLKPLRRLMTAAAVLAALAVGASAAFARLLRLQSRWAREAIGAHEALTVPRAEGTFGSGTGAPLPLAMLGDSLAIGIGADSPAQTAGAILARGLSAAASRPVVLQNVAGVGAESGDIAAQIPRLPALPVPTGAGTAGVAVIITGSNDVTHLKTVPEAVRHLLRAVRALRAAGWEVVVATCPDLGTIRPLHQPLRFVARRSSRLLATAQTIAAVHAGGRTVSLADTLGKSFRERPELMFSADSFHPSSAGYARAAAVLLPAVCAAAGYWEDAGALGDAAGPARPPGRAAPSRLVEPRQLLARAAFRASSRAGAEVSATHRHPLAGRKATLKTPR